MEVTIGPCRISLTRDIEILKHYNIHRWQPHIHDSLPSFDTSQPCIAPCDDVTSNILPNIVDYFGGHILIR